MTKGEIKDSSPPIPFDDLVRVVLPLLAVDRHAEWHTVGTAFVIATPETKTALLLTAAHNLDFVRGIELGPATHHSSIPADFRPKIPETVGLRSTEVYFYLVGRRQRVLAKMQISWFRFAYDMGLVLARIPDGVDEIFESRFALDTRPVEVGCRVMAVGYPAMKIKSEADFENHTFAAHFRTQLQCRVGTVCGICPEGAGIHKWPGFLVNFPLDSGMSGGPIVDIAGPTPAVRGLVGGDFSESTADGALGSGLRAFASMLWPPMTAQTNIDLVRPDGTPYQPEPLRLLDLVRHGVISDLGNAHEHVRFEDTNGTITCQWEP